MKPAVDEMFPEGAGPYVDLDEVRLAAAAGRGPGPWGEKAAARVGPACRPARGLLPDDPSPKPHSDPEDPVAGKDGECAGPAARGAACPPETAGAAGPARWVRGARRRWCFPAGVAPSPPGRGWSSGSPGAAEGRWALAGFARLRDAGAAARCLPRLQGCEAALRLVSPVVAAGRFCLPSVLREPVAAAVRPIFRSSERSGDRPGPRAPAGPGTTGRG